MELFFFVIGDCISFYKGEGGKGVMGVGGRWEVSRFLLFFTIDRVCIVYSDS